MIFRFQLGFWGLPPYFSLLPVFRKGHPSHHDFLVPPGSSWFLLVPPGSSWILLVPPGFSWFRLGFRGLSPYFSLLSCFRKGMLFHHDFRAPSGSGLGLRFSFSFLQDRGHQMAKLITHVVVKHGLLLFGGLCWCTFFQGLAPMSNSDLIEREIERERERVELFSAIQAIWLDSLTLPGTSRRQHC